MVALAMPDALYELIIDESKWITASMAAAALVVAAALGRRREELPTGRARVVLAMNLFYSAMIGSLAFGHLLAVVVKAARGTLDGRLVYLIPLGIALAAPSALLVTRIGRYVHDEPRWRRSLVGLNAWLAISLVALGPHNLPLALPALLNIAYVSTERRSLGWSVALVALVAHTTLFIGSLVFLASGQSFEQFRGLE